MLKVDNLVSRSHNAGIERAIGISLFGRNDYLSAPQSVGAGVGTNLYRHLLTDLKDLGLHTAIGGVALPNAASVALHEKLGFLKVAHFNEVGFNFGQWTDVAYWQLRL